LKIFTTFYLLEKILLYLSQVKGKKLQENNSQIPNYTQSASFSLKKMLNY